MMTPSLRRLLGRADWTLPCSPLGEKASYVSKGRMGSSEHDEKLTVHRAADEG